MTNLKLSSRMRRFVVGCVKRFIPYRVVSFFDKRQRERNSFRLVIGSQKLVIDRRKRDMAGVVPAIYWDGVDNFGDTIGPYLISKITGKAVLNVIDSRRPGMMTVGSILQLVDRRGVVVWGSGLIEKPSRKLLAKIKKFQPEILTVRGHETAKYLKEAGVRVRDMNALGDPGLLMPLFYHPRPKESKSEISLCPHYIHKEDFARVFSKSNSVKVIDVQRDLEDVIDDIVSSDICISTSLHGIIMSQAYGIPWVWLEIVDNNLKGDDFKFNDFFSTLNGSGFAHARVTLQELASLDIQSLAKTAFLPEKKYDEESMLKALDEWLLNTGERAGVESLR